MNATPFDIGFLNSFSATVNLGVSAPIRSAVDRYSVKRMMLLGLFFEIISTILFIQADYWLILIPALAMHRQLIRIMPLTDVIFITFTESHRRSTIMSLSRVFWGILNVFAPITAAVIIASTGGSFDSQGIRPLYYIQLVLYIIVFVIVALKLQETSVRSFERKNESNAKKGNLIQGYRELLKGEKHLQRWILIRVIQSFGMALSAPFITI
ncbi:MAG: transporter [Thermoproteota archaeon]|nr:transporter [Thermoproteota archaeon]